MLEEANRPPLPVTENKATLAGRQKPVRFVWGWVVVGALLLTLFYGRVALLNLTTGVVGGQVDGFQNLWTDYWTHRAVLSGHNPYFTNLIYYPTGISLRFHTLHPLTVIVDIVAWPLLGPVGATNLNFLVALLLTTLFGYLFIADLVRRPLPAFVGAVIFTYASYLTLSAYGFGQTEKLSPQWLPLYAFFLLRYAENRGRWWVNLAGGVLTLIALSLTDWQFLMYAVLLTLLYFAYNLFRRTGWREKGWLFGKLAALGGIYAGLVFFPLLWPMLQEGLNSPWLVPQGDQSVNNSRDLLDFISPTLDNPGYLTLGLAIFGLVKNWRNNLVRFWALAALVFGLFSLGPNLQIAGNLTSLPLPYKVLAHMPILSTGRDPERFFTVYMLASGLLAAYGLIALFEVQRWPNLSRLWAGQAGQTLVSGLVAGVTLAGFLLQAGQAQITRPDWPAFYTQTIANEPGDFAILELPLFTSKGRQEVTYQAFQAIHGKARFGGWLARDHKLDNPNNFVKRTVLFRDFFVSNQPDLYASLNPARDIMTRTNLAQLGLPLLNYYKVRYVVLYLDALQDNGLKQTQTLLKTVLGAQAAPVYQDSQMLAYRVPDAPVPTGLLTFDTGNNWHGAESDANGTRRWWRTESNAPGELLALNLSDQPRAATLDCKTASFNPDRSVQVTLNGQPVTTLQLTPAQSLQPFSLKLNLSAGPNVIGFNSPPPYQRATDGRLLAFMLSDCHLQ